MEPELATKIENADLPAELKTALTDLAQSVDVLAPQLPAGPSRRIRYFLGQLIAEVTDATVDTHWWESTCDFIVKTAQDRGASGQAAVAAVRKLQPILHQQLGPYDQVTLREITADTVFRICLLSDTLTEPKKYFVAPNAISLAQAHFNKYAWFRAIYAGKAPVGFMMIVDDPDKPEYFLWRLMIAEPFHGRGYGRQAIQCLVEYVKTRPNATELLVSCGQGEGSPEEFYVKQGFVSTGKIEDGELVLRMSLV
ncbi:MAG: GNAT family N-acetyltransferase [Chloroflexi bacterium]|nr:GNAT family N-acetyltransferase [Chloroflexota bacterium]